MKKIFLIVLLGQVIFLSGCAGALVGDNGRPQNNEVREQRSIEQIKVDGRITSAIKARYADDVVLRKLNVKTYRGEVTLFGSVPTRSVMERAINLARTVKGVTKVRSGLRLR